MSYFSRYFPKSTGTAEAGNVANGKTFFGTTGLLTTGTYTAPTPQVQAGGIRAATIIKEVPNPINKDLADMVICFIEQKKLLRQSQGINFE